jgi:hypothetical protein
MSHMLPSHFSFEYDIQIYLFEKKNLLYIYVYATISIILGVFL